MAKVTVLGLGAMGSRMAARLIAADYEVTVWNRSVDKSVELEKLGAKVAASPRTAVAEADFVLSMVRDDEASEQVWLDQDTGALEALPKDALAIECSTLSVPFVKKLGAAFQSAERTLVDAPLAGSRPQAEAGQLIFFVGCPEKLFDPIKTVLLAMGSAAHHAGGLGAGAMIKLMVNGLFGVQLAAFAELIGMAKSEGIELANVIDIIGSTPVCSPAAKASAGAMIAGQWQPAFPIELVAKDFGLLSKTAETLTAQVPLCEQAGSIYRRGVEQGVGGDNITGIVQLYQQEGVE